MNEAGHKRRLVEAIQRFRHPVVVFRHEDKFSAGIPDISITSDDRTSWVEVKCESGSPTALQLHVIQKLGGWIVTFADDRTVLACHKFTPPAIYSLPPAAYDAVARRVTP